MRLLLFGPVRTQVGKDHLQIDAETVAELWAKLLAQYPALKPLLPTLRLARAGEFLAPEASILPDDEIAVIPPVSGG